MAYIYICCIHNQAHSIQVHAQAGLSHITSHTCLHTQGGTHKHVHKALQQKHTVNMHSHTDTYARYTYSINQTHTHAQSHTVSETINVTIYCNISDTVYACKHTHMHAIHSMQAHTQAKQVHHTTSHHTHAQYYTHRQAHTLANTHTCKRSYTREHTHKHTKSNHTNKNWHIHACTIPRHSYTTTS